MRGRIWIFAALVAAALVLHLAVLSAKVAQSGEDNVRARLAQSGTALRAQLELLDARLLPRAVAAAPDLIEATRPPADPTQPLARPDDRALRAAASALSPEPDLLAVVNGQGAILSRRAKPAQGLDDAAPLPLAKAALEGNPAPAFAAFDGGVYRVAAARIPGNGAAAVVGMVVDDRLAAQLKSQVDADVTLLQGGKVLASSLPQGDDRARLLRWAAAPAPGYGVLQILLPGVGNALSGKLPRGGTRYAVRGTLVPLDSGVQAALTVPAGPYLGWLGRYQAFYALGLVLFVLFSLVWGLLARPAPAPLQRVSEPVPPPAMRQPRPVPPLLGTDVGEPRTAPPPTDDVPWPAAEATEATQKSAPPRMAESLDPEVPPPPPEKLAAAAHPMWSADPFTPTPPADLEPEPEALSAEEAGLLEAEPVGDTAAEQAGAETVETAPLAAQALATPPAEDPGRREDSAAGAASPAEETPPADASSPAAPGDFSFADLLQDGQRPAPADEARPSLAEDSADATVPGGPSEALLAAARGEHADEEPAPFPGDEPTRIEPVSAALLDKLRERDEELSQAANPGWGSLVPEGDPLDRTSESAPPSMDDAHVPAGIRPEPETAPPAAAEAAPPVPAEPAEANVTLQDFSMPALETEDPDAQHWHETYDRFKELKGQLGEPADKISFEKFAAKLKKNRADLLAKHSCKGVRFSVYEKEGKAAIKATAIR